jgi:peptidoglycan/xylan/chitin deacetylase (PgdA/CDA1 family)
MPEGGALTRHSVGWDGSIYRTAIPFAIEVAPDVFREAAAGLPDGEALAEAVAVRLAKRGVQLEWQEPHAVPNIAAAQRIVRARGSSSIEIVRADPSLLPALQVGSWLDGSRTTRLARRVPPALGVAAAGLSPRFANTRFDLEFWRGVREQASRDEWRRLGASYVALLYHRIAGEGRPEEERLDVPPRLFKRQMRVLRALRFHALTPEDVLAVHGGELIAPRRSYVLTADDGFVDATDEFLREVEHRPQMFVPTGRVGEVVHWAPGARIADWSQLAAAERAGLRIGSHTRRHSALAGLSAGEAAEELAGSLADLRQRLTHPLPFLAYPHGSIDEAGRDAAEAAGYRVAYTTAPGRNGVGTDPLALRRISVKGWDTTASFLWKVVTGTHVPRWWDDLCRRRYLRKASQRG